MQRPFLTGLLLAAYIMAQLPIAIVDAQSRSQGADSAPPTILHNPPDIAMALDEPFLIHAVVSDDVAVARVRLYFRAEVASEYRSIDMTQTKAGSYKATIPPHDRADRAIEYFIQAEDSSGNIALRGAAFEPLRIVDPSAADPSLPTEDALARLTMKMDETQTKPWYKKWWVWTLAGAVVVAAVAGGGGGGGGGDDAEPSSGSATITAPIP